MQYKLSIQEYSAALSENRLLGLQCLECGTITAPPRMACRKCSSLNLEVCKLSGRGKITTFTSVHVPPTKFLEKTPYLIVMVELNEGPWIMGNLAGIDPHNANMDLIGKSVRSISKPPSGEKVKDGVVPLFIIED